MTHLLSTEFHKHRTSCLAGGEFPCPVFPAEPYDPLWDEGLDPMILMIKAMNNRRKSLLLD